MNFGLKFFLSMPLPVIDSERSIAIQSIVSIFNDKFGQPVPDSTGEDQDEIEMAKVISLVFTCFYTIFTIVYNLTLWFQIYHRKRNKKMIHNSIVIIFLIFQSFLFISTLDLITYDVSLGMFFFITIFYLDSISFIIYIFKQSSCIMNVIYILLCYLIPFIQQVLFFIAIPTHPMVFFIFLLLAKLCVFLKLFLTILMMISYKNSNNNDERGVCSGFQPFKSKKTEKVEEYQDGIFV